MESLSLFLKGLIVELPECDNEKEMILKFNALLQDPKLIFQQYPRIFDPSGTGSSESISFEDFHGKQFEEIVIAYVCAILTLQKSILTVFPPGSEFPACAPHWIQVGVASHGTTFC
jgi:hypothetical protein